jgi:hypothetical protein
MSTSLNRRAILAGAAALPAMSIPALAADAELLAIGEKMRALWSPYWEAKARAHEEHERMFEFAGANRPDYVKIARKWSVEEERANWKEAEAKTDHRAAADRRSELGDQMVPLAEAASEFEATTMAGVGVLAAAALFLGDDFDIADEAHALLVSLAGAAGFDMED